MRGCHGRGTPDHPRVHGEHSSKAARACLRVGSSPRARGAQVGGDRLERPLGIIPACAGSTAGTPTSSTSTGDHPRVRGEHDENSEPVGQVAGSSPRARGALAVLGDGDGGGGIIPACAGSTTPRSPGYAPPGGSSPRARGALNVPAPFRSTRGIISACAGSTAAVGSHGSPRWDHPRVRGEHVAILDLADDLGGIIPVCAGSTPGRPPTRRAGRDHPRVRGEHLLPPLLETLDEGSSPRARGALQVGRPHGAPAGIIPACAGSTTCAWPARSCPRDHPRVRGEHASAGATVGALLGSSPRARGARRPTLHGG